MKEKPTEKQLFDALISQTAYGIWVSLGKLQNPVSGETSIDLTQASIQIDMLDMINNKMHASLTDEEREYIDKVLAEAKMNYLEVDKSENEQDSLKEENKEEKKQQVEKRTQNEDIEEKPMKKRKTETEKRIESIHR